MKLELINGQFSGEEIFEIVSKMIHLKIKFHEQKISTSDAEEDIKLREKKIKSLQDKLQEIRLFLKDKSQIYLDGQLNFGI